MAGETILITRPLGDGGTLTEALHEYGYRVVHEPLTEIFLKHTARMDVEKAIADEPDAVLVTSRHGVYSLAALTELRDMALLCVGEETAHSAHDAGFMRVSAAGGDVEKLKNYVMDAYDEGSRFLYVSAEQVRTDLAVALRSQGMLAERIVAYEAAASEQLSDIIVEQLKRGQIDAVTFFSQRSAHIFTSLLEKGGIADVTSDLQAFTLSAAVADGLQRPAWQSVNVAEEPTLASLVECVDNELRIKP